MPSSAKIIKNLFGRGEHIGYLKMLFSLNEIINNPHLKLCKVHQFL